MKKILVLFLSLLALVFVACGKDKDIRDILDNIVEENEKYFEFKDKDDNRDVFRIFMYEKISSIDFKNPKKIDSLEEGYIEQGCDIIYKDKDTIMIGIFDPEVGYGYNIHNFDNSKTTLEIIVAIGSQDELSEKDLFEILKEAKSFIKK